MSAITRVREQLKGNPQKWLVTGSAGFIGSHLVETLLGLDQQVVSIDNFSTGSQANLDDVRARVGEQRWRQHQFVNGDIRDLAACRLVCAGVDLVLHEAALGSVPRSMADPIATNATNVSGFLNILVAARDANVRRFVYAASSSTYGDHPGVPKVEDAIGRPLSPYAVTKRINELYAETFGLCYGLECVGLRYFNVFGPRQDPEGAYAAVIPRWIGALLTGDEAILNGDGETSRDFCYIANVVQANLLASLSDDRRTPNQVFNVAVGDRTSLKELFFQIRGELATHLQDVGRIAPVYGPFRSGDVRHSQASIEKACVLLGYAPTHRLPEGLRETMPWYIERYERSFEVSRTRAV